MHLRAFAVIKMLGYSLEDARDPILNFLNQYPLSSSTHRNVYIITFPGKHFVANGKVKSVKEIKACTECGSSNIIHSTFREQVICKDCGLVFEPFVAVPELMKPKTAEYAAPLRAKETTVAPKLVIERPLPKEKKKPARKVKALRRVKSGKKAKRAHHKATRKPVKKARRSAKPARKHAPKKRVSAFKKAKRLVKRVLKR